MGKCSLVSRIEGKWVTKKSWIPNDCYQRLPYDFYWFLFDYHWLPLISICLPWLLLIPSDSHYFLLIYMWIIPFSIDFYMTTIDSQQNVHWFQLVSDQKIIIDSLWFLLIYLYIITIDSHVIKIYFHIINGYYWFPYGYLTDYRWFPTKCTVTSISE